MEVLQVVTFVAVKYVLQRSAILHTAVSLVQYYKIFQTE